MSAEDLFLLSYLETSDKINCIGTQSEESFSMSETVKIDEGSVCSSCNATPIVEEVVQCFICKSHYHTVCETAGKDLHLGIKTMVKTYLAASTKSTKFLCDNCLTEYERNLVETQNQKITALTEKVGKMETKLDEIIGLLKGPNRPKPVTQAPVVKTCWDDREFSPS